MTNWVKESIFYHIYPLGMLGAEEYNNFQQNPVNRLEKIIDYIDYFKDLGINAIYFGPIFESFSHGYDTVDYFNIDRRLGTNESLKKIIKALHENSIKVILDGVFNHVGRDFFAFRDLRQNLKNSQYIGWFHKLDFSRKSPYGDQFHYEGWNGHYNLVKLNLKNPEVKNYIFQAVNMWIEQFDIDGIRLDAADCLDKDFSKELSSLCKTKNIWLKGEIIHGDYRSYANDEMFHSVTNYECYKGLWSSHNDKNYFEIAFSLERLFGKNGIYKNLDLFNFVDNHDVNRISSTLVDKRHLYPLYCFLFTIPKIPSIYYGSEFALEGMKTNTTDKPLRPQIDIKTFWEKSQSSDLYKVIKKLILIRKNNKVLNNGDYQQLHVSNQQIVFIRQYQGEYVIVAINSSDQIVNIEIDLKNVSSQ